MRHLLTLLVITLAVTSCGNNESHDVTTTPQQDQHYTESTLTDPTDHYEYTHDTPDSQALVVETTKVEQEPSSQPQTTAKVATWHDFYNNRSKAWNEGYDQGYEDGYEDSDTGDYGDSYNTKCRYKGKNRKDYKDGYAYGYHDGFEAGKEDDGEYDYDY